MTEESLSEAATAEREAEERRRTREVPFPPLADQGAFFTFSLSAQAKLEEALLAFDPSYRQQRRESFFGACERHLLAGTPAMLSAVIDVGLKVKNEERRNVPCTGIDLDEIEWTAEDIVRPALEALAGCHLGKSYTELLREMTESLKETS